jgi:hypothetical protein
MSAALAQKAEGSATRRRFTRLAVVMALLFGVLGVSAVPAMASTVNSVTTLVAASAMSSQAPSSELMKTRSSVRYLVNEPAVCQRHGHFSASNWTAGPYGWYCTDIVFTWPFIAPATGSESQLDVNGWCHDVHPGTHAAIIGYGPDSWYCVA